MAKDTNSPKSGLAGLRAVCIFALQFADGNDTAALCSISLSGRTSLQLIKFHPVYLHLYGQLLGVGLAYP